MVQTVAGRAKPLETFGNDSLRRPSETAVFGGLFRALSCVLIRNYLSRLLYFASKLIFHSAISSGVISFALSESTTHFHVSIVSGIVADFEAAHA